MTAPIVLVVAIFLCLLGNGFFSGSEIAIISIRRSRVEQLIAEGSRGAEPLHFKPRGPVGIRDIRFSRDGKSLQVLDAQDIRRTYRDEAGVEPEITGRIPEGIGLDERWTASGFTQKEGGPGHVQMVISPDGKYVVTATGLGTALIWEAPGGP